MNDDRRVMWLQDLRRDPNMLRLPRVVMPRLAFEGRCTLLSAREKLGKSTLVGQGVASVRRGTAFLDGEALQGTVLYFCLDEPLNDLVFRLESFGAIDGVAIADFVPTPTELRAMLAEVQPVLMVIDALIDFAGPVVQDVRDAMQWNEVLNPLRAIAAEFNVAQIWVHHAVRDGTRYADSRALGAKADILVHLEESPDDPNERLITTRGRNVPAHLRRYRLVYTQGRYELAGAELPISTRVYDAIVRDPGVTKRRLRELVNGRNGAIDEAIADLIGRGLIVNRGGGRSNAYTASNVPRDSCAEPGRGTGSGHIAGDAVSDCGATSGTVGAQSGHAYVPDPLIQSGARAHQKNGQGEAA